jgi:hypothetical protein
VRPRPDVRPDPAPTGASRQLSKNEQQRRRQWIAAAEEAIVELENEQEAVLVAMADPDLDGDRRQELARRSAEIAAQITARMADWETWNLELEEGDSGAP